jgi:hypothetical protein
MNLLPFPSAVPFRLAQGGQAQVFFTQSRSLS